MKKKRLDDLAVSAFMESMAMMTQSGIQTDEAVSLLQTESGKEKGKLAETLRGMKELTENGAPLSKAMGSTGVFPEYAVKMVETGESTGRTEEVLFRLSSYYKEQKTISDKIRNATVYPVVMLFLIITVLVVMLTLVLPGFASVYDAMSGSMASSYGYIRTAYVVLIVSLVLMSLCAVALIIGFVLFKTGRKERLEAFLGKIPLTADILETTAVFRFTTSFRTLLASGKLQDEAVALSAAMTEYRPVEEKLRRIGARMEEGHGFAAAAYEEGLLEPVYGRMLLAGERSGNMEEALAKVGAHLEEHASMKIDRLLNTVTPLLSGILMVTVGVALLSIMLPLIGIMNSVG